MIPVPKFTMVCAFLPDGSKLVLSLGLYRFMAKNATRETDYEELSVYTIEYGKELGGKQKGFLQLDKNTIEYFPMDQEDKAFAAFQKRLMSGKPNEISGPSEFTKLDLSVADSKYYGLTKQTNTPS